MFTLEEIKNEALVIGHRFCATLKDIDHKVDGYYIETKEKYLTYDIPDTVNWYGVEYNGNDYTCTPFTKLVKRKNGNNYELWGIVVFFDQPEINAEEYDITVDDYTIDGFKFNPIVRVELVEKPTHIVMDCFCERYGRKFDQYYYHPGSGKYYVYAPDVVRGEAIDYWYRVFEHYFEVNATWFEYKFEAYYDPDEINQMEPGTCMGWFEKVYYYDPRHGIIHHELQ